MTAPGTTIEATEIKIVGKSGQISLGKQFAGRMLRLDRLSDGTVVLTAVAAVPAHQLWTIEEPHRTAIARGLDWAERTPPRETSADALARQARDAARRRTTRSRRSPSP